MEALLPDPSCEQLGSTGCTHDNIDVGSARPIKQQYYYYPVSKILKDEMHEQVHKMLRAGIIRRSKTFTVPGLGLFEYGLYGLAGGPATFQMLADKLITREMEPYAFAYLDDIIIETDTFSDHIKWLTAPVLARPDFSAPFIVE
ncbi:hypothetical protein TSAR_010818 [Trichomalopsis sarcophagae]|uniref:Reverse transcriptase domain-containing protein n=1 Tax=Trichomalopsis sarcophagae TaxID=543379 RepID=A0A232EGJ1_9HYME|nr:hypothetical protein TSAR_010818 [Trichomalopsis sarcophagae]